MVCTAQVGELGRERDWNTYMYMCTIYIFSHAHYMYTVHCTAQVRELGRERERLECRLGQDRGLGGKLELGF